MSRWPSYGDFCAVSRFSQRTAATFTIGCSIAGFTPRRVVLVLYGLCGLAAAFSLLQGVVHSFSGALLLLFGLFVLLGIQYLGYAEFDLAGRLLFSGEFQRSVSAQLDLRKFRAALAAAGTPAACWEVIREACAEVWIPAGAAVSGW